MGFYYYNFIILEKIYNFLKINYWDIRPSNIYISLNFIWQYPTLFKNDFILLIYAILNFNNGKLTLYIYLYVNIKSIWHVFEMEES